MVQSKKCRVSSVHVRYEFLPCRIQLQAAPVVLADVIACVDGVRVIVLVAAAASTLKPPLRRQGEHRSHAKNRDFDSSQARDFLHSDAVFLQLRLLFPAESLFAMSGKLVMNICLDLP